MSAEHEVLIELYRVMDERSARPPAGPGARALRENIRRRHRERVTVRLVAAALVVVLAGAAAWVSHQHSLGTPEPARPLVDQPVRGSLAHDRAFLAAARQRAVYEPFQELGNGDWLSPPASAVKVVYAGDVDGYRWVLVTGPWHHRGRVGLWRWLIGRAGEPAADLAGGNLATGNPRVAIQEIQPGRIWPPRAGAGPEGAALAVGSGDFDARVAGPARYAIDGAVSLPPAHQRAGRLERGVYAAPLRPGGTYRLAVDGELGLGWRPPEGDREYAQPSFGIRVTREQAAATLRTWTGQAPPPAALAEAMTECLLWSGLSPAETRFRLLAAERFPDGRWRPAVAVIAPSGAAFVGAPTVPADGRVPFYGPVSPQAWTIRPAGGLDRTALALLELGYDHRGRSIHVLPPAGSRKVEVLGPDGRRIAGFPVEPFRWSGRPLAPDARRVRFRDAGGRLLAEVPVQVLVDGIETRMPVMGWGAGEA